MKYWAFLSYSHADEAAATKLHRALEHYTLPASVRKAHGLPKRLIPVFRDVEELEAAAGLSKRLESALDESRWLIVLCSPKSAQSKYVNAEIEYFLKRHGPEKILCVLLGEPPEVFPPAIRALPDEPLAADLRASADPEIALLKLVSAMAVIGFTELRNREAQRRKRQRMLAAAAVAGICLGTLAYWDLFHREHVDYYVNYVRRHGAWEGIDRVDAGTAAHRSATYRFTRRGRLNPPRRVDYVNGSGHCLREGMIGPLGSPRISAFGMLHARYCVVEFDYRESGTLAQETWLNNRGQVLDSLAYTATGLAQFTRQGFASAEGGSGVFYVQATRDEAGRDRRIQFLHSLGNPRANSRHEFGWVLDYDDAGRVIRRSVLDDAGAEIGAVTRYRYDARGAVVEQSHRDAEDRLQVGDHGYATRLAEHDAHGNVLRERFLLPDGTPAVATVSRRDEYSPSGFAALAYEWDERGNNVLWQQLDGEGRPVSNQLGFAAERMAYDERGNLVRLESLDTRLQLTRVAQEGSAILLRSYDVHNSVIEERVLDADGKPAMREWGGSIVRTHYDPQQRTLKECFFDAEDKPHYLRYGVCFRWTLDARDQPTSIDFLDVGDKPYARPDSGVARTVIHRDDRGNHLGSAHYGGDLKPVVSRWTGAHGNEGTLDEHGNKTEVRRYDTQRRLMRDKNGVAISRAKYDRSGNKVEETYYDELQRPVRHKEGYFGYRAQFDRRGRMTRKEFLDASGGPMRWPALDAHAVRYEYDRFGNITREVTLDEGGAERTVLERQRNALGWETETRHLAQGQPQPQPGTGCAIERFEHDSYGRRIVERCLDAAARPVNRRDGGWALRKIVPKLSNVPEEAYFDAAGRPVKPRT